MQVSAHAKMRMEERLPNYGPNTRPMKEFKNAMIYGRGCKDFYGEFKNYLSVTASRYKKTNLKVHNHMIWVYEVERQKLVTLWAIPEEFQPYERYLNCNRNEYEKILDLEKKERDEKKLKEMTLESVLQSRPKNIVRGKGKCINEETINYDQRLYEIGYKECRCCGEAKPLEKFAPRPTSKDGRYSYCNNCMNTMNRQRVAVKDIASTKDIKAEKVFLCTRCNKVKSVSEFNKRRGRLGHDTICKECGSTYNLVEKTNTMKMNNVKKVNNTSDEMFSISAINQVIGFSDRLKEVGLSDKEFVEFMKSPEQVKYDMLLLFNHLSKDSRNLYLKMKGE